ncbi:transcriptional regulator [Paenibacillus dokdonensis]|uniref:Transcriptional regulator n=1 Tax=Paenibacillus dokdonensis TaxID=2567944 RepID=A0ABU6GI99_9BACL|nr:transcriptional regulator [Paenibacillus dokdonensis]MEC0239433.1 transcriptional regulator [Paenibacillus dokdonensis]
MSGGLGKGRSRYGRFMDKHGIKQDAVCKETGYNKDTVSKAYNENNPIMRGITKDGLVFAAKNLTGKNVTLKDFWS